MRPAAEPAGGSASAVPAANGGSDAAAVPSARNGPDTAAVPYLTLPGFGARHGFTTRAGGVSGGPYASLNLGLSSGDDPAAVEANRGRLLAQLGVARERVCGYHQVHGARVMHAAPGWFEQQADASVSDDPELLLVVSAADCFPVLYHDPATGAVGAAHCGWRGTVRRLPGEVVKAMTRRFGSEPARLEVAIGQGIMGTCYEVSQDVADEFIAAGFPPSVLTPTADRPLLDVLGAIRHSLREAGVRDEHVAALGRCTHCEPEVFYSHRRDAGRTGRMWGFVQAGRPA